ncbi:MAG: hypothetical protein RLP15_10700 [Cryomorphaceae bacterium]
MNNGIIHRFETHRHSSIWIAQIAEVISTLSEEQIERYQAGHSLERTHQLACADALASQMLNHPTQIVRDTEGGPHLSDVVERVSISHTGNYMAMLISPSPVLALDIEIMDRDVERIIPRYSERPELEQFSDLGVKNPGLYVWGIKECLFKAVPVNGILFKDHLKIKQTVGNEAVVSHCEVEHPNLRAQLSVVSRIFEPLIVSYVDQAKYGHEKI